jgi:uncharacterized protein (TIGR00369 family)
MSSSLPGAELMRQFLPSSPYVGHLGIRLVEIEPGRAVLSMPFSESLITIATVVHGGAIASLVDTAAMVAAWSDAEMPEKLRGATVALSITYLSAAAGEDLEADARVLRRGRSLAYCEVEVRTRGGEPTARALVTYKLG